MLSLKLSSRIVSILVILSIVLQMGIAISFPGFAHAQAAGGGTAQPQTQQKATGASGSVCNDSGVVATITCWFSSLIGLIGSVPAMIGVLAVSLSGLLMDWTIDHTIVQFNTFIYGKIKTGLDTVWTAFRDLANILIIGMFTFIAISIILDLPTFNSRRLIANVIIIAILINFSLLFTRIMIEGTNFIAIEFQQAASLRTANTSGADLNTSNVQSSGIAGNFMGFMGITGAFDVKNSLQRYASDKSTYSGMAIVLGIFIAIFLLAVASALIYVNFLLISRTLLLIFLMAVSPLAFAAYLIPKYGQAQFNKWWTTLLKTSVLAPLLMIFLWATLQIASAFTANARSTGNGGTIGALLSDPSSPINLEAFFSYLVILGMLHLAIRFSSSFANSIQGFAMASNVPARIFGGTSQAVGFAGRQSFGRISQLAAKNSESSAKRYAQEGKMVRARLMDTTAQLFRKGSKADFNPMRAKLPGVGGIGERIAGTAGIKDIDKLAGKKVGGVEGSDKAVSEAFIKQGERLTGTKDQKDRDAIIEGERRKFLDADALKGGQISKDKENVDIEFRRSESRERTEIIEATKAQKAEMQRFTKEMSKLTEKLSDVQVNATLSPEEKKKETDKINIDAEREKSHNKSELQKQEMRIKDARAITAKTRQAQEAVDKAINDALIKAGKLPLSTAEITEKLAETSWMNLFGALGKDSGLVVRARDAAKKKQKSSRVRDNLKARMEIEKEEGGEPEKTTPASAAPTPAKPGK